MALLSFCDCRDFWNLTNLISSGNYTIFSKWTDALRATYAASRIPFRFIDQRKEADDNDVIFNFHSFQFLFTFGLDLGYFTHSGLNSHTIIIKLPSCMVDLGPFQALCYSVLVVNC